jgi:hypothetical protein
MKRAALDSEEETLWDFIWNFFDLPLRFVFLRQVFNPREMPVKR